VSCISDDSRLGPDLYHGAEAVSKVIGELWSELMMLFGQNAGKLYLNIFAAKRKRRQTAPYTELSIDGK